MSGWFSAQTRLKSLGKKSKSIEMGKRVSFVYMNEVGNIDWPDNPADGVLVVPKPLSMAEWVRKYGRPETNQEGK